MKRRMISIPTTPHSADHIPPPPPFFPPPPPPPPHHHLSPGMIVAVTILAMMVFAGAVWGAVWGVRRYLQYRREKKNMEFELQMVAIRDTRPMIAPRSIWP